MAYYVALAISRSDTVEKFLYARLAVSNQKTAQTAAIKPCCDQANSYLK
jgi:hypothetical protein